MTKSEHRVSVDSGKYTFIVPENDYRIIIERHGQPWHEQTVAHNAVHAMMMELDAARVVVQAARNAVDAPTLRRKEFLQEALFLHDRLVSDRESSSAWCGAEYAERRAAAHSVIERDRAMFRAFMKMPTAATLEDLNDMRAEIDDTKLGPADRAEVQRVYDRRKAWLLLSSRPNTEST